ncbi:MAG: hypothetical protein GY941_17805 [Planctomycetes bacterium]|nr:hypothetical protein [Planctomycetota bacterium]
MNIEKVVFTVTEKRIYTITASRDNGWNMPESANDLVELVNSVRADPSGPMKDVETTVDSEIVNIESNIIESNQQG